ncbi:MAG: 30S ribosomal protein S15 [Actinobacteria bacterium]|nr:30S ribosomal protein S15 [Actinomycetota bacterium]
MSITKTDKQNLIEKFKIHENDTGSAEVQIAILTTRINRLNEHLKLNKTDHASLPIFVMMVGKRKRLIEYLKSHDLAKYKKLIKDLGLRK